MNRGLNRFMTNMCITNIKEKYLKGELTVNMAISRLCDIDISAAVASITVGSWGNNHAQVIEYQNGSYKAKGITI